MKHNNLTPISTVINDLSVKEDKWFAVYTKYKCEKYVVQQLAKKGIAAYVPLITKVKRYSSKIKQLEVPIINCYIFVKIKKHEYVQVLQTEYVMGFIKQRKNLIHIPEAEIDILKMIVGEIENVDAREMEYGTGDEVEIIKGNLAGIKGKLIEKTGNHNFVVELSSIGLQLTMTIEKRNLRLIKKKRVLA